MNKSEIVGRVAGRMGLSKPAAEGAVDTVLAAIGEALAKGEDVRIAGFGTFATRTRRARRGPAHGGECVDTGLEDAVIQGGQGAQGNSEPRLGIDVRGAGGW